MDIIVLVQVHVVVLPGRDPDGGAAPPRPGGAGGWLRGGAYATAARTCTNPPGGSGPRSALIGLGPVVGPSQPRRGWPVATAKHAPKSENPLRISDISEFPQDFNKEVARQ